MPPVHTLLRFEENATGRRPKAGQALKRGERVKEKEEEEEEEEAGNSGRFRVNAY